MQQQQHRYWQPMYHYTVVMWIPHYYSLSPSPSPSLSPSPSISLSLSPSPSLCHLSPSPSLYHPLYITLPLCLSHHPPSVITPSHPFDIISIQCITTPVPVILIFFIAFGNCHQPILCLYTEPIIIVFIHNALSPLL